MHNWHVYKTPDETVSACADFLADAINKVIKDKGVCHVALPGGTTPAACLKLLSTKDIDWHSVYWYLGDERCLPDGDKERNDVMLANHFWNIIDTPFEHIFVINTEEGVETAAKNYSDIIDDIETLDIAFLGMGEDGHTASLFPDNPALSLKTSVVPVHDSPKPPADRVSLGLSTLQKCGLRVILAMGEGKRDAMKKVAAGFSLPVNMLGDNEWFTDQAAFVTD